MGPTKPEVIILLDNNNSGLENSRVTITLKYKKRTTSENKDNKDGSPSKKAKV